VKGGLVGGTKALRMRSRITVNGWDPGDRVDQGLNVLVHEVAHVDDPNREPGVRAAI
jgi:hypothetical protein